MTIDLGISLTDNRSTGKWWLRPLISFISNYDNYRVQADLRLNVNDEEQQFYHRLQYTRPGWVAGFSGMFSLNDYKLHRREFLLGRKSEFFDIYLRNENSWKHTLFSNLGGFMGKVFCQMVYRQNGKTFGIQVKGIPEENSYVGVAVLKQNVKGFDIKYLLSTNKHLALAISRAVEQWRFRASAMMDLTSRNLEWGVEAHLDI